MNQFKQIFGSLPRHVPSNSVAGGVAASGCQTEGIFRSARHQYLRTCSLPRNVQSATFVDDRGPRHCRRINDEGTQAFLYGRPKLALFHNRNSSMDRVGDLDGPFHRPNNMNCHGKPGFDRKTLKTEAYRSDGARHIQSTISSSKSRTYANMIAEYSEAMEKKKHAKKSEKSPRGLLARLPFESVVSSLTMLERTKLSKGRVGASNSLAAVANRPGKEYSHALTDTSAKTDKRKASPTVKKDPQKRDYFTKNGESPGRLHSDFDFVRGYREIENEKENFASRWIHPKSTKSKKSSMSITIDDLASSKARDIERRKFKKLNVLTSDGNMEIKIPVYDCLESEKKLDSGTLVKSRKKFREFTAASNNPCVVAKLATPTESGRNAQSPPKASESTNFNKPPKSLTPRQSSTRSNKALPWWASLDCISGTNNNKPRSPPKRPTCLNDVHASSSPTIQALVSEQVSQIDKPAESQRSTRRGRRMTSIAKITRHIEEELEDRRRQETRRTSIDKTSVPDEKSIRDSGGVTKSAKLQQKKAGAASSGAPVIAGSRVDDKKEAVERRKKRLAVVLANKQEDKGAGSANDGNLKSVLSKMDKKFTPSIRLLQDVVKALSKKSNESDRGKSNFTVTSETTDKEEMIDHRYKVKRISDALRPIEKKKDGTLIDYGLKVPTRKPRKRSEKSTVVESIPKKTIFAPHQQQQQPTVELSQRKSAIPPKPTVSKNFNPVPQSRSEMPLTKTSKLSSANDRLGLQSKQKPAIRAENLADKNRGKPGGGLASGKSDNGSCVGGPLDRKNNKSEREGNCAARSSLANGANSVLTFFKSEQMLDAKNAMRAEMDVCGNQSAQQPVDSDIRPEKELIYSAWLNRFHTRKHTRTIK
ncbi:triadin-like [Nasonia vitripennis]|uniref:Uncharacterized protein n=1 Tax=Nasonia vitripennis TaxID=7425 RepID=A0A7M7QP20_NASVI|nr:triadin-like [Nasonia vitripennis]XP_032452552.1 triadin-like [Nasonia vitripennis]XP_032452553.1 triadin-like [Nasonia vitripennis]XP_032452554.1 triadin-like [Nasonia vitripennis]